MRRSNAALLHRRLHVVRTQPGAGPSSSSSHSRLWRRIGAVPLFPVGAFLIADHRFIPAKRKARMHAGPRCRARNEPRHFVYQSSWKRSVW